MGDFFEPSYNKRNRNHDYYGPFIYHIILKKLPTAPVFSKIVANPAIKPYEPGSARTDYSKMGYAIYEALREFEKMYKEFKKWQYSIMPDHVHIILQKNYRTGIHLEEYMKILKSIVAEKYHNDNNPYISPENIFTYRFTDKLLFKKIKLKVWIEYVGLNPHRKAMIMQRPEFFRQTRKLEIGGGYYEGYGNLFLFRNPDKFAVRMRRHFSEDEKITHLREALCMAKEGTVLVSPFLSPYEKNVREKAEKIDARLIHIQHEAFPDKFKPAKHDFELCSHGRLLIISMGMPRGTELSYEICTKMNELAASICEL